MCSSQESGIDWYPCREEGCVECVHMEYGNSLLLYVYQEIFEVQFFFFADLSKISFPRCTLDEMPTSEFATPSSPQQQELTEQWPICLEVQGYYAYQDSMAGTPVKGLPDPNMGTTLAIFHSA